MSRISTNSVAVALGGATSGCDDQRATDRGRDEPARAVLDAAFEVGGGKMHLRCEGAGEPTVVFDAALGQGVAAWSAILPAVARTTRACAYDRKGVGASDPPTSRPHAPRQMADELHELLERASLDGPYVLVGHSIGGINMRLFASKHPRDVAGMVLVEAADDPKVLWSLMPEAAVAARRAELAKSPEGLDLDTFVAGAAEMHALSKSIGATPLVVLSRGQPDAPKGAAPDVAAAWLDRWNAQQAELPALSTNVVRVVAPSCGHMLPAQAPSLVIAAVEEVLRAARTGARVEEACLLPFSNECRVC